MPILFDRDLESGVTTYFDYDPIKDQAFLTYEQDVSGFLDRMNEIRNNPEISAKGMQEEWWHYCSIPEVVEIDLMNRGLFLHKPDDMKQILKIINSDYPYLKATTKRHT
jgi:hypothetical protein